jgi:hypothetical protein
MLSAVLVSLLFLAQAVAIFASFATDRTLLAPWHGNQSLSVAPNNTIANVSHEPSEVGPTFCMFGATVSNESFLALVGVALVLALVAACLLVHLCLFHAYINWKGITTYEYVRAQREATEQARAREAAAAPSVVQRAASPLHTKSSCAAMPWSRSSSKVQPAPSHEQRNYLEYRSGKKPSRESSVTPNSTSYNEGVLLPSRTDTLSTDVSSRRVSVLSQHDAAAQQH